MQKKFRSRINAVRFAGVTGLKVGKSKPCKMADGTKGRMYTLTKGGKKTGKRKGKKYGPYR